MICCEKLKNINLKEYSSIKKWLLFNCMCKNCKINKLFINNKISKLKIKKYTKTYNKKLILTNKMIIKIQIEIKKKEMENLHKLG